MIAVLESTDMIEMAPGPGRVWQGETADGAPIVAFITLIAGPTGDNDTDVRLQRALETRIVSTVLLTIPVRA